MHTSFSQIVLGKGGLGIGMVQLAMELAYEGGELIGFAKMTQNLLSGFLQAAEAGLLVTVCFLLKTQKKHLIVQGK